jgi:hypothetical protein
MLKNHILSDPFVGKQLSKITRADVLDLRLRLFAKNTRPQSTRHLVL